MKTIRVFVGIPISGEVLREIGEWRAGWKGLPVRWIPDEDLHITLIPPWDVEESYAENLVERLSSLALPAPFSIFLTHAHYGPSAKRPRLIWAEGAAPDALGALQSRLGALFEVPPRTSLRTHLTLARFAEDDFKNFPVKEIDDAVKWGVEICDLVLYETALDQPSAYRHRFRLRLPRAAM